MGTTATAYRRILVKRDVAQNSINAFEESRKAKGELEVWEKTCLYHEQQNIIFCNELLSFFD